MVDLITKRKIRRHQAFWNSKPMKRPLLIVRIGDVFPAKLFTANRPLLENAHVITPQEIHVNDYIADYLHHYDVFESIDQDAFFTAEPLNGFPWMEAILGAKIVGGGDAFLTQPKFEDISQLEDLFLNKKNLWYQKYLEFVDQLVLISNGRFTVGQPILRGATDTVGALLGQVEMLFGMIDNPELMKKIFQKVINVQRELVKDQYARIPDFHGGYSIGFYHLWTPGKAIWYQEDLLALLATNHFNEFLKDCANMICIGYDYSLMHLHSSSFMHLDQIINIKGLKAIQINKDVSDISIYEMIPQCMKVLKSGKKLVLGMGTINEDDIDCIFKYLPNHSTALIIVAPDVRRAQQLINYINEKSY